MKSVSARGTSLDYLTLYPDDFETGRDYPLILILHGFGANKEDLAPLAPLIDKSGYVYVLPDAPLSLADDATMRAWYERGGKESPAAVQEALAALDGLVQEVLAQHGVPGGRALLVGFSQGGALALRYGLPRPEMFAGLAILSGSLRQVDTVRPTLPVQRAQPIFIAHGKHDELVPFNWSQDVLAFLQAEGYQPEMHEYPIGHEISPGLVGDLRCWIKGVLPPRP